MSHSEEIMDSELNIIEKNIGSTAFNLHELINLIDRKETIENPVMIKNKNNLLNEIFNPSNNGIQNVLNILSE